MIEKRLYQPDLPNFGSHGSLRGRTGKGTGAETVKGGIEIEIMIERDGKEIDQEVLKDGIWTGVELQRDGEVVIVMVTGDVALIMKGADIDRGRKRKRDGL